MTKKTTKELTPSNTKNSFGLTDKQELYCQLRSQGYTKTKAASVAYNTNNPKQVGHEIERVSPNLRARIEQLKEERAEVMALTGEEQVRRYQDIYIRALEDGKYELAMKAMERIDTLCGFEAAKHNIVTHRSTKQEDLELDKAGEELKKFSNILKLGHDIFDVNPDNKITFDNRIIEQH